MSDSLPSLYPVCPVESPSKDCVLLAHGEGGRMMRRLLHERILPALGTEANEDAAYCKLAAGEFALTTDSFVVSPLFFPGGDIGSLCVYGTVNDLAVSGAAPLCLTLSFILEEGLALDDFDRILTSIAKASRRCGVSIAAGDTKVVPRGAADKLYINTTGVGYRRHPTPLSSCSLQTSDVLIVSGPIGHHGVAVMSMRENLNLTPQPISDCAPLMDACGGLHARLGSDLRAMRDATRGGISSVLHEWSQASNKTMRLKETQIPVSPDIRGVCELLGLDPLYVANEGTFVAAVAPEAVETALGVLRQHEVSRRAQVIGEVVDLLSAPVVVERLLGVLRPVDEPSGAPLPRIC